MLKPHHLLLKECLPSLLHCCWQAVARGYFSLHQKIREEMVTHFPNNRIIVLPQTAYFKHEENLQKSAALFRSHSGAIYWLVTKEQRTYLHNFQIMFICHRTWRISFMAPWKRKQGTTGEQLLFLA